jgi:putative ABC transport system permease protein
MQFHIRPGVRRLFRLPHSSRAATHRDIDEELDALIANRVDHLIARGMPPDAARAEALRRLGTTLDQARVQLQTSATQGDRRMRWNEWIESVTQDVRYAARGLIRRPAFTAVAVATLAVGVGATTAIFSAVNVLLLRPLPYARPNELMRVPLFVPADGAMARSEMGWSYPMFSMFRDGQRSYAGLAAYTFLDVSVTSQDAERVRAEYVSANYLSVLGLLPARGRAFDASIDAHAGAPHEAFISYALWQRRFNGDPAVVGRTLDIDRQPWAIIGVGPKDFRGLTGQADLLLPAMTLPADRISSQFYNFLVVARRAPGVTVAQAAAATTALGARVAEAFPNPMGRFNWQVSAAPLDDARLEPAIKRSVVVLFGAVCLVLLIACANVANLLLGRATARKGEIAVRVALGAGRARVIRLLVIESLLLAFVGGVASVAVAWFGVHALGAIDPVAVGRATNVSASALGVVSFSSIALDLRALSFTFAVSLVVGLSFGLAPALGVANESPTGSLKSDRRSTGAAAGRRMLVVAEVALALVLLAGAGLMMRSLAKLLTTPTGFDATNMLTFRASPPRGLIAGDSMPGFYAAILARLRALPVAQDVALAGCVPLSGAPCGGWGFQRADRPAPSGNMDMNSLIGINPVTPNWFAALHVPLKRGRLFTAADRADAPPVVLLNETAATKFFPGENPIGKHVFIGDRTDREVIGIVAGVRHRPDSIPAATAYAPLDQAPIPGVFFFVRSTRDAASIGAEVRRAMHEVAPQVPVYDMLTMTQRLATATAAARFRAGLLAAFALTALSLAAIGIYGVMSFAVTARTREIGVRMALGAEGGRVQRLVIGEGLALTCVGGAVGLAGALGATRLLRAFLFDLTPSDPITYGAIVVLLGAVALLATWIPARRASRVDPMDALRAE